MKYFELELNNYEENNGEIVENGTEIIKLRLTAIDITAIESSKHVKFLDYIQDYSITTIVNLLRNMRKFEKSNFSEKDACELYDKLVDNGFTVEQIMFDVIYKGLIASGVISEEDLNKIKEIKEEHKQEVSKGEA